MNTRIFVLITVFAFSACQRPQTPEQPPAAPADAIEAYAPGLGEIMTLQQMRHTKLWFAGKAGNWDLAAYEIKELGEGFDDILKFHPSTEESSVAPKDAIPRIVTVPLKDLQTVIDKKDSGAFDNAYDAFTMACNSCHEAMNFGFNVVQRPATNPYPDQVFEPARKVR